MALPFKLLSFSTNCLVPAKNKLYLVTMEGDVVEINLIMRKDSSKNSASYKIQVY